MNNICKVINGVPTPLITFSNPFDCNGKDVIICITGNPGITEFYIEFGSELHKQTSLPICIIGHAGHEEVPNQGALELHNNEHLFNLKGQTEQKLELILKYIDKNSKVHIIGHSIGAWMVIELIDKNTFLQDKILSTNLLFPTVQKMAETKNGFLLNKVVRRFHLIIIFYAYLLSLLPTILFEFTVKCYLYFNAIPESYSPRIEKVLNPRALEKVLYMAYNEMDNVVTLNSEGVKKLCCPTNIIYSVRDNWAPVHYIEDLKNLQPLFELNQVDIAHAFVIQSSERVALMVAEFICPRISKK